MDWECAFKVDSLHDMVWGAQVVFLPDSAELENVLQGHT